MKIDRINLLAKIVEEKKLGLRYRERRHDDWTDNYMLERMRVQTNRLTQRQEVCVPLMKGTIKTVMSKIGEKPALTFEDRGGDQEKEIVMAEAWKEMDKNNVLTLLDKIDKKQELLCGRSYKKLNWKNGAVTIEIKDIFDITIDPKTKTTDIETAKFWTEMGIYRTVEDVYSDTTYDEEGISDLKLMVTGMLGNETTGEQPKETVGQNLTNDAQDSIQARNERMELLGADNLEDDLAGADIILELNQCGTCIWDNKKKQWVRYICVMANESVLLSATPLKEALGVDFWPLETWADDLEVNDFYTDGIGDILRVPNQMINVWYSQYMENRTLRNYGMNFFDDTINSENGGWEPPEMEPRPGGWYGLPGKPREVFQRVDIPDLSSNREDIQFLINIAEKETASSDIEKGAISDARRTLGEIEIAVSKAQERMSSLAPFYNLSWERTAMKWYLLTIANMGKKKQTLYKKNYQGILVPKEIKREDIYSEAGYEITAESESQKSVDQIDKLNKLFAIKNEFPNNKSLTKAIQKRALKVSELSPEEIQEISSEEEQIADAGIPEVPVETKPINAQGSNTLSPIT